LNVLGLEFDFWEIWIVAINGMLPKVYWLKGQVLGASSVLDLFT